MSDIETGVDGGEEDLDRLDFATLRRFNALRCETRYHPIAAWSLSDWYMTVGAEFGELGSEIKTLRRAETEPGRNGHAIGETSLEAMGNEAADVVIYLDLLCESAGIDLGAAVRRKFNLVSTQRLSPPGPILPIFPRRDPSGDDGAAERMAQALAGDGSPEEAWAGVVEALVVLDRVRELFELPESAELEDIAGVVDRKLSALRVGHERVTVSAETIGVGVGGPDAIVVRADGAEVGAYVIACDVPSELASMQRLVSAVYRAGAEAAAETPTASNRPLIVPSTAPRVVVYDEID
jgi:NTP pyrophosphatase (non-canonical NTP hydrolase)